MALLRLCTYGSAENVKRCGLVINFTRPLRFFGFLFLQFFSCNSSALKVGIYFYFLVWKVNYMLLVDDRIIKDVINAEIEINLMPLGIVMLVLTFAGIAYLKWSG